MSDQTPDVAFLLPSVRSFRIRDDLGAPCTETLEKSLASVSSSEFAPQAKKRIESALNNHLQSARSLGDRHTIGMQAMVWKSKDKRDNELVRIGGIASTENLDRQGEVLVQKGLDFGDFLRHGWFNDDHKAGTLVGYPTEARFVRKGEVIADGRKSPHSGWYVEGYLLDTSRGQELAEIAKSLEGTGRHLGFSVEGRIKKRSGKKILKADVTEVAVTKKPVNADTFLKVMDLAKALSDDEEEAKDDEEEVEKTLTTASAAALIPESLEDEKTVEEGKKKVGDTETGSLKVGDLAKGNQPKFFVGEAMSDLSKAVSEVEETLEQAGTPEARVMGEELAKSASVDVSGFLKSLTDATTGAVDGLGEELVKAQRVAIASAKLSKALAERIEAQNELLETMGRAIVELGETPAAPAKGVQDGRMAKSIERFEATESKQDQVRKLQKSIDDKFDTAATEGDRLTMRRLTVAQARVDMGDFNIAHLIG